MKLISLPDSERGNFPVGEIFHCLCNNFFQITTEKDFIVKGSEKHLNCPFCDRKLIIKGDKTTHVLPELVKIDHL